MILRRIIAPAEEPITLAEAKTHCDIVHDGLDTVLPGYIAAATAHVDGADGILGRALVTQTWDVLLSGFPRGKDALEIPLPPLQSVSLIEYRDTDGVLQTLAPADYRAVPGGNGHGSVVPAANWPATDRVIDAVRVRFVAGFGAAASVPQPIRSAILLLVRDQVDTPSASVVGMSLAQNPAVDRLLFPWRSRLIA